MIWIVIVALIVVYLLNVKPKAPGSSVAASPPTTSTASPSSSTKVTVQNLFNIGVPLSFTVSPQWNIGMLADAAAVDYGLPLTPTSIFTLRLSDGTSEPIPRSSAINTSLTYTLLETNQPLQWIGVKLVYLDGKTPELDTIYAQSVPLSLLLGFDSQTQALSTSHTGSPVISDMTQTVGSIASAGLLILYVSNLAFTL